MSALGWDHNAYYQRLLLRHLPQPCGRVLEVGCGAGAFAAQLATRAEHVDALDRSANMIDLARLAAPSNVTCLLADVLLEPLPAAYYDAIVSNTALHHMQLDRALPRLAQALRPGGVLAVVALPRTDMPRELPAEICAAIGHRVLGAGFAILRAGGGRRWYAMEPSHAIMPMLDGSLTTRQVRHQASALLAGARVRRLVFWRYLLLWRKPVGS
jgi:SAM-dependent methyltransferase